MGKQGCTVCRPGGQPSLEDHEEAFRPEEEEEEKKASEAPIRRLTRTEEMKIRADVARRVRDRWRAPAHAAAYGARVDAELERHAEYYGMLETNFGAPTARQHAAKFLRDREIDEAAAARILQMQQRLAQLAPSSSSTSLQTSPRGHQPAPTERVPASLGHQQAPRSSPTGSITMSEKSTSTARGQMGTPGAPPMYAHPTQAMPSGQATGGSSPSRGLTSVPPAMMRSSVAV